MSQLVEVTTRIRAARQVVFDLELDMDAHAASLARSKETASTSSGRPVLGLGDDVTFTARHFGLPWRMTSRITEHERPSWFVDEQVRGPFRVMRHEHCFEDDGQGGTIMKDRMTVTAPMGILGVLPARLVLAPYLRHLLTQRADHIRTIAEASVRRGY